MENVSELKKRSLEAVIKTLTFHQSVEFLKSNQFAIDFLFEPDEEKTIRNLLLKIARLCLTDDRVKLLNAIGGRFDLHTKKEWEEHANALSQGFIWDYGYKQQRILIPEEAEKWVGPVLEKIDEDDEPIIIHRPEGEDGQGDNFYRFYRWHNGLPIAPFNELKGKRLHHVQIMGSLPKSGSIGAQLEIEFTFGHLNKKYEKTDLDEDLIISDIADIIDGRSYESPYHFIPESSKVYELPFFLDSGLTVQKEQEIENKILEEVLSYMKILYEKHTPYQVMFERWFAGGMHEDSLIENVNSWEEYISSMSQKIAKFSIVFANPDFIIDEVDTNEIHILMRDMKTVIKARFHFMKIGMPL